MTQDDFRGDPGHSFHHAGAGDERLDALDVVGFMQRHRRSLIATTVVVGLLTLGGVALTRALPPVDRVCSLDVTPTFPGAAEGIYPNKTRFSPQDIVANFIVEPVWRDQGLEKTVELAELSRNLQVTAGGTELELVRSDYLQRLSNAKLTTAERMALESEFNAKLKSMKSAAVTLSLAAAGRMTDEQMSRLLTAIPAEWARATDASGARSYDFPLPLGAELRASGAQLSTGVTAALVVAHAERVKEFMDSLVVSVDAMSKVPGSDGIKESSGATIVDLASELASTRRNVVIPAYVHALRQAQAADPLGYQSIRAARRQGLDSELQAAKERARVLREALEGYSDDARPARRADAARADDQRQPALTANIDASFIDRVVEQAVKGRDMEYRRALTDRRLQAELEVVTFATKSEFEQWIDSAVRNQQSAPPAAGNAVSVQAVTAQVAHCGDRAKEIFRSLSERNLNSAAAMYRIDSPPVVHSVVAVPVRTVISYGAGLWFVAMALVVFRAVMVDRRRQPAFARLDAGLADEFRRQSAAALTADGPGRSQPRRLPDDRRQPVG
jgi:hypothetical protein